MSEFSSFEIHRMAEIGDESIPWQVLQQTMDEPLSEELPCFWSVFGIAYDHQMIWLADFADYKSMSAAFHVLTGHKLPAQRNYLYVPQPVAS